MLLRSYSTVVPLNTASLGTGEKSAVFRNGGIGREYNLKKPHLGLEMGGGIGRAVLGGRTVVYLSSAASDLCSACVRSDHVSETTRNQNQSTVSNVLAEKSTFETWLNHT